MAKLKRYNDFLNESFLSDSRAPLYHSAPIHYVSLILESNMLKSHNISSSPHVISFTRDKNFVYEDYPITFVLDQEKLRQHYEVKPVDYFYKTIGGHIKPKSVRSGNLEYEEAVRGNIRDLNKYLIEIRINKSMDICKNARRGARQLYREMYDDTMQALLDYCTKYGIKVTDQRGEINSVEDIKKEIGETVYEKREQLTLPFREKAHKGKTVHEHLIDALEDLVVMKNYKNYKSKSSPDDEIKKWYDKVMLRVVDDPDASSDMNEYAWDFIIRHDPRDKDERREYYSRKFMSTVDKDFLKPDAPIEDIVTEVSGASVLKDVFTKKGWEEFLSISSDKFSEETSKMSSTVQDSYEKNDNGLIDVWRTVEYSPGKEKDVYLNIMKHKGVGVYWSWDEDNAQTYWGEGGRQITLHGQVSVEDVDWEETLYRSGYYLKEETEVRTKDNARVMIVGFRDDELKKYYELEEPLVVKAGDKETDE